MFLKSIRIITLIAIRDFFYYKAWPFHIIWDPVKDKTYLK